MKQTFKFDLESRMVSIDNDDIWQTVPAKWDASDYCYDHGGTVYQEACRAFWAAEDTMKTNEFFYTDKCIADHASVMLETKGYQTGVSRVPGHSESKMTTNAPREIVVAVNTEIFEQL